MKIVDNGIVRELTPEEVKEYLDAHQTYEEKIISKIRTKYSVDDELAILRQRDSKPEEFIEYFNFVENIKQSLKEKEVN